ncbi:MAG: S-layer homology domain-containing protein, partial [Clostridiales bacterium]|nr:S-layer homology domain-containing protein [Clostridiales bacterium]
FNLYPGGVDGIPQASVRAVVADEAGGIWLGTNGAGMAYISPEGGVTKYSTATTPALKTDFVTGIAIAPDGGVWLTQGGSVGSQNAPPSAHYGFACFKDGAFTFYDSTTEGSTLPSDCIYGLDVDKDGLVWLTSQHTLLNGGMEGGLTRFDPASGEWRSWTMADGLPTMSAWAVKADNQGGAWVTTYRTSNVDDVAWPNQSYAHVSAAGFVTAYSIPAGIDFNWSRSVSVDPEGGVYITRMSGAHDPANDGGWLDYIAPGGGVTSYKGDDLIPDLKAKARQGFYPEIRTVFVDAAGDLWLSTNGLGVFRCAVSDGAITVTDNYWSGSGSWPAGAFDDVWSMYVSPEGLACFGSNGGLATAQVELGGGDEPDPQPVVLDPPFTIKGWGGGEIAWIVGGSGAGNPIKSMPNDAGRAEKDYSYDGQLRRVRGAMLIDILAASGVSGDNVLVSINTTDGFSRDNYKDISLEDVAAKNYFVAYDIYNIETDAWDKVADVDRNNVQASLRIYRDEDAGATGERNNEIKGLSGITISQADDGDGDGDDPNPDPNDSVVLTVIDGDILVKEFTKSEIDLLPKKNNNYSAYNTNPTYRTYSNVSGVDIWNLLAGAGLAPEDDSEITFFASDGFSTTLKISDLTTARYFFSSDGVRGDQVPPVISFDSSGGRLYFGQLAAQEQTAFAFAQMINRIVIGGTAGTNGTPVADPPSGSTVNEGDPIVLSTPSGSGNAKIYYTLDGSTPDMDSPMYNISGQDANPPLYVPEGLAGGTFTITARIIGLGRFDGDIVTFTYDVAEPVAEAIRITFNTNGGSVSPASMLTGADGKLTSLPTPTRGGYIFAGWFTAAAGGNRVTTDTVFTGDATIHAQWYDDYEHPEGILAVYNGSVLAKDLSQSDIDELPISTNDYSTLSTFPTYESIDGISGVSVISLLAAAGLSPDDGREITFIGSDGFSSTLKIGDLTATRYHFSEEGVRGTAVPPVINFDNTGGRLYFGQLTAQEQTRFAFVGQIDRIVVGGVAGAFGEPTANPASGSTVKKGGEIRLDLPEGAGRAKIYYTLDGSAPTMLSAIYNVSAYVANPPILVPKDYPEEEFTITAQIIGLGRYPGSIVEFTYTVESGAAVGEDMGDGDTPTAGIPGPGAATVVIEANAVPLGDMPVLPFDKVELSEKIQEAIAADGDKILELKINAAPTATSIDAKVPTDSIKEMVDAGLRYLVISSPLGSNSYDLAALTSIAGQAEGNNFDFIIRVVDPDTLDEGLQAVVGSNDVFEILVLRGDTEITSFGAGLAVTRINYALKPGQSAYGLKVWHVGADGKLTEIACTYNSTLGYVEFIRNSHSYYMVGYDAEAAEWTDNPFLDVNPGDWFYDNVRFAFARGLMTGVADDRFGPNMTLTRGMVVTVLHRIAGSPATAVANPFGDVPVGEWYADAVAWAASKGVVAGYGDGAFGPEDDITREQMAAILANYEAFSGRIPPAVTDDRDFADAGDIGGWAKDAVDKLARQGIIGGKPGNLFDPKGNATRAEFAAILQRFLEAE